MSVGALQPMAGASGNSTPGGGTGSATANAGGTGANTANVQSPGLTLDNLPRSDGGASSGGCSLMGAPRSSHLVALAGAGLLSAFAFRRRVRRERSSQSRVASRRSR